MPRTHLFSTMMFGLSTLTLAAGIAVGGAGCVGATANPPLSTRTTAFNNPNAPSTWDTSSTAMRWVVRRYPPQGSDGRLVGWEDLDIPAGGKTYKRDGVELTAPARFIVNMPPGTRRTVYDRVIDAVGLGAVGPTLENAPDLGAGSTLPIYHVTRVHVMGDEARVEILRPISTPAEAGGQALYQAVNVQLRGGLKPWTVLAGGAWSMGTIEAPPVNYMPEPEHEVPLLP